LGHYKSLFACVDRTFGKFHRAGTSKKNKRSGLGVTGHICFGKMALAGIENLR